MVTGKTGALNCGWQTEDGSSNEGTVVKKPMVGVTLMACLVFCPHSLVNAGVFGQQKQQEQQDPNVSECSSFISSSIGSNLDLHIDLLFLLRHERNKYQQRTSAFRLILLMYKLRNK